MNLYINTKDRKQVVVEIRDTREVISKMSEENEYGSQVLLPLIDRLLKKCNLDYNSLSGIEVETGPGSFTGLRVGVSVANALGYVLDIPVNRKKMEIDLIY